MNGQPQRGAGQLLGSDGSLAEQVGASLALWSTDASVGKILAALALHVMMAEREDFIEESAGNANDQGLANTYGQSSSPRWHESC